MKRIFILIFSLILFFSLSVNVYAEDINPTSGNDAEVSEEQTNDENLGKENESDVDDEIHGGEIYDIQKVKVVITKVVKNGDEEIPLVGCVIQIKNSEGKIIDTWTSDGEEHIIELPDGDYVIHEESAPAGYNLAEDIPFTVKVKIESIDAGTDVDPEPCNHYQDGQGNYGVVLYYVEINGVKHEVYCINQSLGTPDENSIYDGQILNSTNIKDYTVQSVYVDAHYNEETKDISDPSLSGGELYDKFLDIIYHRYLAKSKFPDLTETEIRYVTENALKNYSNTGLTEIQRIEKTKAPVGYDKYDYYEDGIYYWYLYPMYRSFVYLPDAPLGEDIFTTTVGGSNANSFGNLARHWNASSGHNAKSNPEVRAQVARYYELYNFLISEENPHPEDMNLYIYSTDDIHYYEYRGKQYEEPYQNLLGITGYFEEFEQEEQHYQVENTYNNEETTSVTVKKEWDDNNNQDGIRPDKITVTLSNGDVVELNEENNWTATISNLPKYYNGVEIEYTWTEIEVEGYESTKIENDSTTTFTNYHKPDEISVSVQKEWNDKDNETGERPESIIITLLADGEEVDEYEFNASEDWYHEFTELPKYKDGHEVQYSVLEKFVPGKYKVKYDGDYKEILFIYNDLEIIPPHTGFTKESIAYYIMIFFMSLPLMLIKKEY